MNKFTKKTIRNLVREMYDDVKPGYSRMGMFDRPGPIFPDLKTVVPELPISAMSQTAAQLSTELPNIDDAEAQPVGPDLKLFMSALADRVPDEDAAKFYRKVRRYIEKHYGVDNDERVGKIEEVLSMDKQLIERIVRKVNKKIAMNEGRQPLRENLETKKRLLQFFNNILSNSEQFEDEEIEDLKKYLGTKYTDKDYDFDELGGYVGVFDIKGNEVASVTPQMAADYLDRLEQTPTTRTPASLNTSIASPEDSGTLAQPGMGVPSYFLRATSKADDPGIESVYYIRDEDLAQADDYARKSIYAAKKNLLRDIKNIIKPRVLNFLGLARTVQRGSGESAAQVKEDPNYDLTFDYYPNGWEVMVKAANDPEGSYLVASSRDQSWTIVKAVIAGQQQQPPFGEEVVELFRMRNVIGSGSKMTRAKAYEYQRMTGQKAGEEYRSSYEELSPVARQEFPGTYSADKEITSAVKEFIERNLLRAFLLSLTHNRGIKAASKAARRPAIDKIADKLQGSYAVSKNGEPIESPINDDAVMNLFVKHYTNRDPLHLTAHTEKIFKQFNDAWKNAFRGSGIPRIIFDNRLKNSIGAVMTSLLVSKLDGAGGWRQQFDVPNIDELFESNPKAFYTQAAATEGMGKEEWAKLPEAEKNSIAKDFYDKVKNLCEDALNDFVKGLSEVPEPSEDDAASWIMDAMKDNAFQADMEQAGITMSLKQKSKKGKTKANEGFEFFDKFMERITESKSVCIDTESIKNAIDHNQRLRRRAAAEQEHHLHTVKVER
jgi:hypothetical protein